MMKKFFLFILTLSPLLLKAQTKVFKEVNEGISTEFKPIFQNGNLIGYLAFSELERANKDSFSYRINIMDENLNDLGIVNFREKKLDLQQVSFVNDTLCMAYLKSNVLGYDWGSRNERNDSLSKGYLSLFAQFISLDGKIAHTFEKKLKTDIRLSWTNIRDGRIGNGGLKHSVQLKNQDQKGFTFFFGDDAYNYLLVITTQGELLWEKYILEDGDHYKMLTSGRDVLFLITAERNMAVSSHTVISYDTDKKAGILKLPLLDQFRNPLLVMAFNNDPATGKPYLAGYIHDPMAAGAYLYTKNVVQHLFSGIFVINVDGHEKTAVKRQFSYWTDKVDDELVENDFLSNNNAFMKNVIAFRDFQGNTYITGTNNYHRSEYGSVVMLKQDPSGKLSVLTPFADADIDLSDTRKQYELTGMPPLYSVSSSDTRSTYLIVNAQVNSSIYSLEKKKVVRVIPHKDGNIRTNIYPAKEGHVIVAEYNRKEKYTKLSIEAI
ncbi:DUF6770 family protein [Chitinophaga pinensis]|uniref:Uncharacterized protein n=1 Tax=Chitinophaga pinensis (strain ATCC 43595 / DSM 2588 / LMG 13176 / NBRC 15968 / NCIMB 11800 / UQM 2034) TaxID=485918 RepID=A0A979G8F3_CHIPD|nr:DUF6770 family protein [Chitinophaga pinensis]ACU62700.1 hypothetical protein Cpin_5269 [Chitinophaga pinensis DSM 2588]